MKLGKTGNLPIVEKKENLGAIQARTKRGGLYKIYGQGNIQEYLCMFLKFSMFYKKLHPIHVIMQENLQT